MFKIFIKKLYTVLFPFINVWMIAFYLLLLFQLNNRSKIPISIMFLLFLPVIFFEFVASNLFALRKPFEVWPRKKKERILILCRIFFWLLLFLFILVASYALHEQILVFLNCPIPYLLSLISIIYIAEHYVSILVLLIWVTLYYILVIRKRVLRIFTSFILPGILTGGLMYHFYFLGGVGECFRNTITAQKGVEIFYSEDDFPKKNYFHHKNWTEIARKFPRDLYIDAHQNAIYVNYSTTYGNSRLLRTPNILRIDLKTKETKYFVDFYSYDIDAHAETVIATPWIKNRIYELSKDDLSVVRKFPEKIEITPVAILNIYHDHLKDFIYLLNDMKPALLKYDYKTGKLIKILYPENFKQGAMWNFQLSRQTGMIYLIIAGEAKSGILEIDPETLKISRKLFLDTFIATALKLDDENGLLYFQDGHTDKLYEIDVKNLKIQRVLKGEVHSRGIHIDKGRNCLYLLSYFYGRLIALDLGSGKQLWSIKVGGKPYSLALNNDTLYINSRAGIVKVDLETVWKDKFD